MNPRAGNGAVEAAAVVDEPNGPLAHNGLENATRFPQLLCSAEHKSWYRERDVMRSRSLFFVRSIACRHHDVDNSHLGHGLELLEPAQKIRAMTLDQSHWLYG